MKLLTIAIDGPSGAGKGTLARTVADRLGYRHVDTGAMYRAVGWKAQQDGLALDDDEAVAALADHSRIIQEDGRTEIDGYDVTREIRTPALWGLRFRRPLLHDGSASTPDEAILRHSAEAERARRSYEDLSEEERAALLKFLASL